MRPARVWDWPGSCGPPSLLYLLELRPVVSPLLLHAVTLLFLVSLRLVHKVPPLQVEEVRWLPSLIYPHMKVVDRFTFYLRWAAGKRVSPATCERTGIVTGFPPPPHLSLATCGPSLAAEDTEASTYKMRDPTEATRRKQVRF